MQVCRARYGSTDLSRPNVYSGCVLSCLVRPSSLKPGKIVIVLNGRYAGRKAVIVQTNDQGTSKHSYGHAIVAGIDKYPRKVTKSMSKKKIGKRSKITPFVKLVNYNHVMPTRYAIDLGDAAKAAVDSTAFSSSSNKEENPEARKTSRDAIKKIFEEKYLAGKNKWFYQKLRF
jgi:large subunit ribosomal protein L27e